MLITFEGIDGSGKSTQAARLADALAVRGRTVQLVREPGGTPLGERVRETLLSTESAIAPTAELLLFSAARAQLVDVVIKPALGRGDFVVADRFYDSTTAYQGGGRGVFDVEWLDAFHLKVTGGLTPARTFLLDVPVALALQRREGMTIDRMEAGGAAFFERVRSAYLALAARHPSRVTVLDGTRAPDELHADILASTHVD